MRSGSRLLNPIEGALTSRTASLDAASVILTVPAAWDATACSLMRESAIRAGLVQSSRGGDVDWRDRLQIITSELFILSSSMFERAETDVG